MDRDLLDEDHLCEMFVIDNGYVGF